MAPLFINVNIVMRDINYILVFCINLICLILPAQNRPGFFYNYAPDFALAGGVDCSIIENERVMALTFLSNNPIAGKIHRDDRQCLTFIDSALSGIDTTIYLNDDTSNTYIYSFNQHFRLGDTSYFLLDCINGDTSATVISRQPTNLLFFKMGPSRNFSKAKYIFKKDTLGILYSSGAQMVFNNRLGLFEMLLTVYDTSTVSLSVSLFRFNKSGNVKYYKEWDYAVQFAYPPFATDFEVVAPGKYLITQPNTNNIYFIADTAKSTIDTSFYKPDIREFWGIVKRSNSYMLFGISDGHSILSKKDGKLQYAFMEIDKQTLQEKSRTVYKMKDTLNYNIEAEYFRNSLVQLVNGDYIIATSESLFSKSSSVQTRISSIYRMDSTANLIWSYRIIDSVFGERMGANSVVAIPNNPNRVLWNMTYYSNNPTGLPGNTWIMKVDIDGSNLGIGLREENLVKKFSLYPNPVQHKALILLPFLPSGETVVETYSIVGQLLNSHTFTQRDNLLKLDVDQPTGTYVLKVISGGYEATQQMVVE